MLREKPVSMLVPAENFLIVWLEGKDRGLGGESWVFGRGEVEAIPEGYYAAVRVELRKVGGEPKEVEREKCKDCGGMHEKGEHCPYKRGE